MAFINVDFVNTRFKMRQRACEIEMGEMGEMGLYPSLWDLVWNGTNHVDSNALDVETYLGTEYEENGSIPFLRKKKRGSRKGKARKAKKQTCSTNGRLLLFCCSSSSSGTTSDSLSRPHGRKFVCDVNMSTNGTQPDMIHAYLHMYICICFWIFDIRVPFLPSTPSRVTSLTETCFVGFG